jgi:hypothetical protein
MPIGHLLAVALFDGGEVGLAGGIFRHAVRVIEKVFINYLFTQRGLVISSEYT